jgi:hypothetical protein
VGVSDMPTRITGPFLDVLKVFLDAPGQDVNVWSQDMLDRLLSGHA